MSTMLHIRCTVCPMRRDPSAISTRFWYSIMMMWLCSTSSFVTCSSTLSTSSCPVQSM